MDANRSDILTAQYVWAIQSEREWHDKTQLALKVNFGKFRRVTAHFINVIERAEGEKLSGIEWAFVVLELWRQGGGDPNAALSDPGTLSNEYETLLTGDGKASVKYVRQADNLFAVYGDVYTWKPKSTARQGRTYTDVEVAFISQQYHAGVSFKDTCESLRRAPLGLCEKMINMGLIKRDSKGDYICAKNAIKAQVANPCSEISLGEPQLCTLPYEIEEHTNSAAGRFERVAEALKSINQENQTMTTAIQTNPTAAIETKTVIFGRDATSMSEQDLIDAIKRVEGDIAKLKEVKTKSKKIAANIAELETNLEAIVAVLDAR